MVLNVRETMSTTARQPLRLPASAIPDGCPAWDSAQARRWTRELPPRWVPMRVRRRNLVAVICFAPLGGGALAAAGVPALVAALLGLQVVWLLVRPEAVRVTAALQAVVVVWLSPGPSWVVEPGALVMAVAFACAAHLRLRARLRQRAAAPAATGGVTAVLPDAGRPHQRGKVAVRLGPVALAAGAALVALAPRFDAVDDRSAGVAAGLSLAGLGLTALLSGALVRRRAAALRREPAAVLRVLVREGAYGVTEVFATDDVGALRPLFTVTVTDWDAGGDWEGEDGEPGPMRDAVLYGAPYDGAEVLIVSAAQEPGGAPVAGRPVGPVRPLTDGYVRRGLAEEKYEAKRDALYEERGRVAAEVVADDPYAIAGKGVRRWRAGWPDWLSAAGAVVWAGHFFWGESPFWRYGCGGAVGIVVALLLPRWVAWRITADSEGLWFNGLRRAGHIAWDDLRVVECKGIELKVDSRRIPFDEWSVLGFRWPWLERKAGLVHPYERTAAEIAAMWREPGYRPLVEAGEPERGRLLWPLGVVAAVAWAAGLILLP